MTQPRSTWHQILERAVEFRRELHRHPELTWEEEETAKRVRKHLDDAGIKWKAFAKHGTVATLASDAKGEHIALRGDMDALPIEETSGVEWSSKSSGVMHACGHDGHTATLMATAWWLKENEDKLPGPVSLIFQPAEEGGHGAKKMIEEGALKGIDKIFGQHNWPAMKLGKAVCPDGPVMAANGTFHIHIRGVGGHSSQPELCKDPIIATAAVVMNLQQIVSRKMPPHSPCVLSVTSIEAPSKETVIPEKAYIAGSIRAANTVDRDQMNHWIEEICEKTGKVFDVDIDVELRPRYGATVNHGAEAALYRQHLEGELGKDWEDQNLNCPIMASEDFSYYLEKIPGAFALIGSDDGDPAHGVSCHNSSYDFNDKLIGHVVAVFAKLSGL